MRDIKLIDSEVNLEQRMQLALNAADEPTKAANIYRQILQQYPKYAPAYHQLGVLLCSQSPTDAIPLFEQAIKLAADNTQYWVSYIEALMLNGELEKALAAIQLGQQYGLTLSDASLLAENCIALMESLPNLNKTDSKHVERSDAVIADSTVNKTSSNKNLSNEALEEVVAEVYQAALKLQQAGDAEEAARLYQEILQVSPKHPEANHNLGFIEAYTKSIEDALPRFELAVMGKPECEQYWVSYIDALIQFRAYETAFQVINYAGNFSLSEALENELYSDLINHAISSLGDSTIENQETLEIILVGSKLLEKITSKNELLIANAMSPFQKVDPNLDMQACEAFLEQFPTLKEPKLLMQFTMLLIGKLLLVERFVGHKIVSTTLDEWMAKINLGLDNVVPRDLKSANVVIASEVYDFGGHTKEIISILNNVKSPVLVITDISERIASQPFYTKIAEQLPPDCIVFTLPKEGLHQKATRLAAFINAYARNVFLLTHHHDVIAPVACQKHFDVEYYFLHHADHHISIGNTIPHLKHVDLFGQRAQHCHEDLSRQTMLLPTTAEDQGVKHFQNVDGKLGTVTAGSFGKFRMDGAIALAEVVIQCLRTGQGSHYHFGTIPADALQQIYTELAQQGFAVERFVYMGHVPSLWQALLKIDAHVFIGSAPIMGAKSDIEAQGAGYPLLAYRAEDCPRHLNVGSHAPTTIYWHDMLSFQAGLQQIMAEHAQYAQGSRAYYEQFCSVQSYHQILQCMSE